MKFLGTIIFIGLASMLVMASDKLPIPIEYRMLPYQLNREYNADTGVVTYKFREQYLLDRYSEVLMSVNMTDSPQKALEALEKEKERLMQLEKEWTREMARRQKIFDSWVSYFKFW